MTLDLANLRFKIPENGFYACLLGLISFSL